MASNWLLRGGIVILVLGMAFFLKYSIEKGLINPPARVVLSVLAGLAFVVTGLKLLCGKYRLLGHGLVGGGIAVLYFAVFAAANFYHLIGLYTAFGLMAFITFAAGVLAVRINSVLVALLGILGGYATPLLLATGEVNFPGLFAYLLILGVGILGIAARRNWYLLNYLSFAGTYTLFSLAVKRDYAPEFFWQVLPFLVAFFVLYSTVLFIFNVRHGRKSTLIELLGLLANAALFYAHSYRLIAPDYGREWVAVVTLGLTAFYTGHIYYFRQRRLPDRELVLCFTALAVFFLSVTMPLVLTREWLTVSWAVQALVLLWVGGRLRSRFLSHLAYALYALVLVRFYSLDLQRQFFVGSLPADISATDYLLRLLERAVVFGVPVLSLAGAWFLSRRPDAAVRDDVERANDIAAWLRGQWVARLALVLALLALFCYLHLEVNRTVGHFSAPLRLPALSWLWVVLCLVLLREYLARPGRVLLVALTVTVLAVVVKLFAFDLPRWHLPLELGAAFRGEYSPRDAGLRLLDFGLVILFLGYAWRALGGQAAARQVGLLLGGLSLLLLFVWTTLEVNAGLHQYLRGLQTGGVSILWSLFALGLLVAGIRHRVRALRLVGLALFAVVTGKVFLADLAALQQVYRIIAFIALGVLILAGAFSYLKYQQLFIKTPTEPETKP